MYEYNAVDNTLCLFKDGRYHSYFDLPAIVSIDSIYCAWYNMGVLDRDVTKGPALITKNSMLMFKEGKLYGSYKKNNLTIGESDLYFNINIPLVGGKLNGKFNLSVGSNKDNTLKIEYGGFFKNNIKVGIWTYAKNDVQEFEYYDINGNLNKSNTSFNKCHFAEINGNVVLTLIEFIENDNKVTDHTYMDNELTFVTKYEYNDNKVSKVTKSTPNNIVISVTEYNYNDNTMIETIFNNKMIVYQTMSVISY